MLSYVSAKQNICCAFHTHTYCNLISINYDILLNFKEKLIGIERVHANTIESIDNSISEIIAMLSKHYHFLLLKYLYCKILVTIFKNYYMQLSHLNVYKP